MTVLGFIAALVQALAWPVVVLIIAIIFHRQIKGLMSEQLRRFKAGPVDIEWERQVVRVEELVEPVPTHLGATWKSLVDELGSLASEQPGWAVLTAFDRVVEKLRPLLVEVAKERPSSYWSKERPYSRLEVRVRAAVESGHIKPEVAGAIEGMVVLRDLVAHGAGEISPERARQYLRLADAVIYALAGE